MKDLSKGPLFPLGIVQKLAVQRNFWAEKFTWYLLIMKKIRTSVFKEVERANKKAEQEKRLKFMWKKKYFEADKKIKKLEKEIRKYKNENTPSSMIPVYIKEIKKSPSRNPNGTKPLGKPRGSNGATKPPPLKIDEVIEATTHHCPQGHSNIKLIDFLTNIFYDINNIEMRIIEGKIGEYRCLECNEIFCATHQNIPKMGMIGPNLQSLIIELKHNFAGSYQRISNFLEDISKNTFSPQGLKDSVHRTGKNLEPSYLELEKEIRNSKVVGSDETGWPVNGEKYFLWLLCSMNIVLVAIEKSRSRKVLTRILGNEFDGTVTSDCFSAYQRFARFFQKCWAHLLRTTYSLAEENKKKDIVKLHRLLDNLFNEMNDFLKTKPPPKMRIKKHKEYEKKLSKIMKYKWRCVYAKGIVKYWLKKFEGEWLTAILIEGVELTNNKTERCIRKVIPTRKLLGGHRTEEGARYFSIIESHRQTWKIRGESPYLKMVEHLRGLNAN